MSRRLELLVTGVQKSCLQKSDVKKPVRVRTVKEQTKKAEVSEARWDVESERSQVSQVSSAGRNPVIWVDIVSKVMSQASGAPSTPTTPSLASPRRSLPDTFQDYLRENLRLMAEIRTAKKRRLYNRHILRAPDEDLNWTSNAPRPCRPPLLLALAQVRKKRRRNESLDIPPGLSGVRVQATEKVKRAASRTFGRLKKRRSVDGLEFTFNDDLVFEEVKLKKRKKKRRVKKKVWRWRSGRRNVKTEALVSFQYFAGKEDAETVCVVEEQGEQDPAPDTRREHRLGLRRRVRLRRK